MLRSIFYARFHQERGPTVIHQVPEGSVIPLPSSTSTPSSSTPVIQAPLFDFASISDYIIPRREFCDKLLVVCCNKYRIVGYPICITDDTRYDRNDFIFNLCIVLDEDAAWSAYASVASKLAHLFRNLEEQGGFLSREEERDDLIVAGERGYGGRSKVYALCEMVMEDLNNYRECMIPIDESNTLNLKLFPTRPPPAPVHSWHVPLSIVRFSSLQTSAWDLSVQRIIPYIDGVSSVSVIATLADTDLSLTRRAIAHLVYYGCVLLLDIFSFGAIYAPTAEIGVFVFNEIMQDECRRYIATPISLFGKDAGEMKSLTTTLSSKSKSLAAAMQPVEPPSRSRVIDLYASLRHGQPLRDWCLAHSSDLAMIDVRRFITFGIIKGFLYRVQKYPLALRPADLEMDQDDPVTMQREHERAWRKAAMSSGWRTPTQEKKKADWENPGKTRNGNGEDEYADMPLARYLDGMHCLDEICTELRIVEREAIKRLRGYGDVVFVHR